MLSRGWWWALFHTETYTDSRYWILQLCHLEYVTFLVATEGKITWRTVPRFLPFPHNLLSSTGYMTPSKNTCAKKCWEAHGIFDEHYYFCYSWITSFKTQLTKSENLLHRTLEFHSAQMASPTRWTWVWVNSRSWWWTGRPGVLRFMGSQRVGHNWVTKLNWTELGSPCQVTVENSSFMFTLLPQSLLEVTCHTLTNSSCCIQPRRWVSSYSLCLNFLSYFSSLHSTVLSPRLDTYNSFSLTEHT